MASTDFSVIIPTYRRTDQLRDLLTRLSQSKLGPGEILVHVDAGDSETPSMLAGQFPKTVAWIQSTSTQGPGGGRNLLVQMATTPLIVSLDDDSWPMDPDFFALAVRMMEQNPKAGIVACAVNVAGAEMKSPEDRLVPVSNFENCGCVIRREAFLQTSGFLPLRHAYGMEEADLSLQILDHGWDILHSDALRVFHDTVMAHHSSPPVNAAHITNTALLAFLRYPRRDWPLGALQVLNRVRYATKVRRFAGIVTGLMAIPSACWRYRHYRKPVRPETLRRSRALR